MPHRAASPAGSESEYDISNALADGDFLSDDSELVGAGEGPKPLKSANNGFDANDILEGGDDSGDDDWAFIAAQQAASNKKGGTTVKGKTVKKGGGFQAMGLGISLLKAITRKGFNVPTPIQRKAIPLILDGQDVVGMARTGSGKTAAFVIPMIERLKAHSAKVGARALIMSPSRELALQTLKVVKEFGKGTDLKCVLLVGGDSLEEQFGFMAGNPDIVIATPGRFLHLKVEMELDLKSIQYVVFDEADRLFEMGFSAQLTEILHALPSSRQTLLFSATLPTLLVEFAKAGLQEPSLVRLDADAKISLELESAFFSVKPSEKEGALLHILQDIIKIPQGEPERKSKSEDSESKGKKRKRPSGGNEAPYQHSTIVFAATKHHVEYLARLLSLAGFAVSYVYGSLDQVARRNQVSRFRAGETKILVVTDVAARGIDIPVLANVINYDFPPQPKVFIHRVGRTARAGRRGWSYNLVKAEDAPYLIDLQLFLGRKLILPSEKANKSKNDYDFAADMIGGGLQRDQVERCVEWANKLLDEDSEVTALKIVAMKGEKLYLKTRSSASAESVKRAKEVVAQKSWTIVNPLFEDNVNNAEIERAKMLARVSNFRPSETIFEIGQRGLNKSEAAAVMRKRREKIKIDPTRRNTTTEEEFAGISDGDDNTENLNDETANLNLEEASDAEIEKTFSKPVKKQKRKSKPTKFEDSEHFMSYNPKTSLAEDRGYSITGSFAEAARGATMDLTNDDSGKGFAEAHKAKGLRWDKKAKKYVQRANDEDGSKGAKMIIGESGQKIAASFKSGRFENWKSAHKISRVPRTGEIEAPGGNRFGAGGPGSEVVMGGRRGGRMFHKSVKAPKPADKARDDYEVRKKRFAEAKEKGLVKEKVKTELKSKEQIRKDLKLKQRRREKNARPSRKKF
ncbi:ATP-dependent RNA helicase dbp10 [Rhizina undulata]